MGEFYGINLFLAESSATTGGLDSLLEPTGNIKKAQEMAARAFGADHVFFVTNGTSTSQQDGACRRWCSRATSSSSTATATSRTTTAWCSAAAQPLYVEAFPLTEYSMYGAVPLAHDQEGAARPARPKAGSTA